MSDSRQEFRAIINDPTSYIIAVTAVTNSEFDILTVYEPDRSAHGIDVILNYYQCMDDFMKETGSSFIKDETPDHEHAHSSDKDEAEINHSHLKLPKNYITTEKFNHFLKKLESCGAGYALKKTSGAIISSMAASYAANDFEACQFGSSTSDCYTSIGTMKMPTIAELKQMRQNPVSTTFAAREALSPEPYVHTSTQFTARNIGTDILYGSFLLAGVLACTLFGRCRRTPPAQVAPAISMETTHQHSM